MSSLTGVAASDPAASVSTGVLSSLLAGRRAGAIATAPTVLVAITVATLACHVRWSLADSLTWQCDEIPLLVRFTGLCGHAVNEAQAAEFTPSFYTGYMGALRSLRPPKDVAAIHTTTGFWSNLTLHLFGYSPGAGRAAQVVWSIVAIAAAGWAAWLAMGSVYAVCFAVWIVALSPHATAHAAQARGYAEAMALAPLLLIALEYYRRRPDRWLRCTILFLIALQLSLTVYTVWVYWVFPVLLLSVFLLPGSGRGGAMPKRVFKMGRLEPSRPPSADEGALSRTSLAASLRARLGKRPFQTRSKQACASRRRSSDEPGFADVRGSARTEARGSRLAQNRAPSFSSTRALLVVMLVGLCCVMAVYTIDRWTQLTFSASVGGVSVDQPGQLWGFLNRVVTELFPSPAWLLVLAPAGVWALWHSSARWWLWMIAAGVVAPVLFALSHGSPGYVRNFGYLLVPIAVLLGAGADLLLRVAGRRMAPATVGVLAGLAMVTASAWAYRGLEQQARAIILPDWGEVVKGLDEEPETVGPRWICHCLANHWQINWYREPQHYESFLQVPAGDSIEVVMGAQLDHNGMAKVFRIGRAGEGIVEGQLPDYIARAEPQEVRWGVEIRRWRGTRQAAEAFASMPGNDPVFVLADLTEHPSNAQWERFLFDIEARERGVVTFKPTPGPHRPLHSMIVPADLVDAVNEAMQRDLHAEPTQVHFLALSSLFVAQRLDGIEPGGTGGGIDAAD